MQGSKEINVNLRTLSILATCLLIGVAALPARAQLTATGGGIVVDGAIGDWDLEADYFADMFNAGRNNPGWPGYAVLSTLYLRYDCETGLLCALVLDDTSDDLTPELSPDDAWMKLYGNGWANNKLIDGDGGGNTEPRAFAWVFDDGVLVGYEACAALDQGFYGEFEAHLNIGGATSSTGKHAQGYDIPLEINCERETSDAAELPQSVELEQNYPNPFNPTTTIGFRLDGTAEVRLAVYDLLGREVATLAEGLRAAGPHRVTFDAAGLAAGVYVYRLEAEGRVESKRLTLVK